MANHIDAARALGIAARLLGGASVKRATEETGGKSREAASRVASQLDAGEFHKTIRLSKRGKRGRPFCVPEAELWGVWCRDDDSDAGGYWHTRDRTERKARSEAHALRGEGRDAEARYDPPAPRTVESMGLTPSGEWVATSVRVQRAQPAKGRLMAHEEVIRALFQNLVTALHTGERRPWQRAGEAGEETR